MVYMCALIVLAARKKRLLRDEHGHAAEWLPISVCKKKCMLLCTLASLNECVSVSTRRETSHIDRPLRLAAPASRTPAPCSAAARRARCAFYRRARNLRNFLLFEESIRQLTANETHK